MDKSPEDQMFGKGKGGKKADSFAKGHKKGSAMGKKMKSKSMSMKSGRK